MRSAYRRLTRRTPLAVLRAAAPTSYGSSVIPTPNANGLTIAIHQSAIWKGARRSSSERLDGCRHEERLEIYLLVREQMSARKFKITHRPTVPMAATGRQGAESAKRSANILSRIRTHAPEGPKSAAGPTSGGTFEAHLTWHPRARVVGHDVRANRGPPAARAQSYPAVEMILDGRNAQCIVRFDGWVDHAASRLDIIANDKIVETLVPTGTASLMPWPPLPLCWHQSVTTFIGVRSLCPTVIYQKG